MIRYDGSSPGLTWKFLGVDGGSYLGAMVPVRLVIGTILSVVHRKEVQGMVEFRVIKVLMTLGIICGNGQG